jgi:biopolymer transport protein ExbD
MHLKSPIRRPPLENTVPLINVVFLMLIFFMLAGSITRDDAHRVSVPLSMLEDEAIRSTGAIIIAKDGRIFADDIEITAQDGLARKVESHSSEPIKLAADGDLPAHVLHKTLRDLQASGAENITLITSKGAP